MNNRDHPTSKAATRIAAVGFMLMITYSAQQQFDQKLVKLNALSLASWKVVKFDSPNELTADVLAFRTGEHRLTLYDQYRRSLEFKCSGNGLSEFCRDLNNKQLTPTQFEFYVRYNPKSNIEYYDQHKIKRIDFLDAQQRPQSLDVMKVAPNSSQYIAAERKSFHRFFLLYGFLYAAICISLLIYAFSEPRQSHPIRFYTANIIAAAIILHYLYFIVLFLI